MLRANSESWAIARSAPLLGCDATVVALNDFIGRKVLVAFFSALESAAHSAAGAHAQAWLLRLDRLAPACLYNALLRRVASRLSLSRSRSRSRSRSCSRSLSLSRAVYRSVSHTFRLDHSLLKIQNGLIRSSGRLRGARGLRGRRGNRQGRPAEIRPRLQVGLRPRAPRTRTPRSLRGVCVCVCFLERRRSRFFLCSFVFLPRIRTRNIKGAGPPEISRDDVSLFIYL